MKSDPLFRDGGCQITLNNLDSYISGELPVETKQALERHLEGCAGCAAERDARAALRARLKTAVSAQIVPPELQVRIRTQTSRSSATRFRP